MSAKQEIADLVARVGKTPGWTTGLTGRNHHKITAPNGEFITASVTPRGSRPLTDLRLDLKRLGWTEDAAEVASDERAVAALVADREANDRKTKQVLARAKRENAARETATIADAEPAKADTTKGLVFIPPTPSTITTPFVSTASLAAKSAPVTEDDIDLSDYRQETVYLTYDMACEIAGRGQCRQRHLYEKHAGKLAQAMNRGEWRNNPADSLVFDEHEEACGECIPCKAAIKRTGEATLATCSAPLPGCLINGQHRVWARVEGNQDAIAHHYPHGVPFRVTYGFPSALAHIFDTGKARNASDALTVGGLAGWGTMESAALRMAMNFDQSFQRDDHGNYIGERNWLHWRHVQWTNTELTEAADAETGRYANLTSFGPIASRLYSRAKVTRTTGMVLAYLLDRDNPDGGPHGSNADFFDGVCGSTELNPRDPRLSLMRYCMRGTAKEKGKQVGLVHLVHALRRYADWNLGLERDQSTAPDNLPVWPVWQDGMKIIGGELRYDKRDPRGAKLF